MPVHANHDPAGDDLPESVKRVVAPLVRVAFGLAVGGVLGGVLFLLTGFHAWASYEGENALFVWLLGNNFLPGVEPTTVGAFIALGWGLLWGFAIGWLAAAARNAFMNVCVRFIAWRERLRTEAHVLDDLM